MRNCKKENSSSSDGEDDDRVIKVNNTSIITNKNVPLRYMPEKMDERMYLLEKKKQEAQDVSMDFQQFRKNYKYNSYKNNIKVSMKINKISNEANMIKDYLDWHPNQKTVEAVRKN